MEQRPIIGVKKTNSDTIGRLAYCYTYLRGNKISIYVPNNSEPMLFSEMTKDLLTMNDYHFVVGSDINTFINSNLEKSLSVVSASQVAS